MSAVADRCSSAITITPYSHELRRAMSSPIITNTIYDHMIKAKAALAATAEKMALLINATTSNPAVAVMGSNGAALR